ncbi:hypothetical protein WMY93_011812 [Mugilogobius chulae]|uniref:G-protein coupled receptors family 1 profile domain-containing protein n=1 Tax=Mugilogobius chulae TaxID=88201 RepID=A0AAW0PES2_9GOBI
MLEGWEVSLLQKEHCCGLKKASRARHQKSEPEVFSFTAQLQTPTSAQGRDQFLVPGLLLPLVQILVLVLALPANLLALWILLFRSKRMPSTVLLINLTVCDCCCCWLCRFGLFITSLGMTGGLGEPLCRLVMAMFYGNMYGSVLCLAFIAVDRYVALVHPFGAKVLRSRHTSLLMVMAVWLVVFVAMLPLLLMKQTFDLDEPRITMCHDARPQSELETFFRPYFLCLFCVCFAVPLFTLLFCHGAILRSLIRQGECYGHAIRATVLVLTVFIVCFVPSNILLLLSLWDEGEDAEPDRQVPYMLSLALSAFNTVLDPFIYYYISINTLQPTAPAQDRKPAQSDRAPQKTEPNSHCCVGLSRPIRAQTCDLWAGSGE